MTDALGGTGMIELDFDRKFPANEVQTAAETKDGRQLGEARGRRCVRKSEHLVFHGRRQ
jgi:hypothetical protein